MKVVSSPSCHRRRLAPSAGTARDLPSHPIRRTVGFGGPKAAFVARLMTGPSRQTRQVAHRLAPGTVAGRVVGRRSGCLALPVSFLGASARSWRIATGRWATGSSFDRLCCDYCCRLDCSCRLGPSSLGRQACHLQARVAAPGPKAASNRAAWADLSRLDCSTAASSDVAQTPASPCSDYGPLRGACEGSCHLW